MLMGECGKFRYSGVPGWGSCAKRKRRRNKEENGRQEGKERGQKRRREKEDKVEKEMGWKMREMRDFEMHTVASVMLT